MSCFGADIFGVGAGQGVALLGCRDRAVAGVGTRILVSNRSRTIIGAVTATPLRTIVSQRHFLGALCNTVFYVNCVHSCFVDVLGSLHLSDRLDQSHCGKAFWKGQCVHTVHVYTACGLYCYLLHCFLVVLSENKRKSLWLRHLPPLSHLDIFKGYCFGY